METMKPLVDPFCLCGMPHPCLEHGADNPQAQLFPTHPPRRIGQHDECLVAA